MRGYHQHTDQQLIELVAKSEEDAFTELYNRYWKNVFSHAINKLGRIEEAEEVVQEVFADLWKRRDKISIRHSVKSYIAGAAKFQIFSVMRRNYKTRQVDIDSIAELSNTQSLAEIYNVKELRNRIENAIQKLPESCRMIFRMSRDEGMKNREIADVLDISVKTVENQMTKALKRVRLSIRSLLP